MSFYINEFKQHLRELSSKVDHPYDEPARRQLNNPKSIEETYSAMSQPRGGSYQRPAPTQLNEQVLPWRQRVRYGGYYIVQDSAGNFYVVNAFSDGPGIVPVAGPFKDNRSAAAWAKDNPGQTPGGNTQRAMRGNSQQISNVRPRKDLPTLGPGGFGGGGGPGGGPMP